MPAGAQQTHNAWHALEQGDADVVKQPHTYSRGEATLSALQDKVQLTTRHDWQEGYTSTAHHSEPKYLKNWWVRRGGRRKTSEHELSGCKILGWPWSTSSPNLGPRTGFGRTQEPSVFCITRNSALWCTILHSLIEAKEHLRLIFPFFLNRRNATYSGQSIPQPGPKWFIDSLLKQHKKILQWVHKQIKAKPPLPHKTQRATEKVLT